MPAWLLSVWIASGLLFIGSAYQLLRKNKAALLLFVLGVAFNLLGSLSQNLIPSLMLANHVAATFPHPNFRRDVLVPLGSRVLLPALIAVCLWWMARVKHRTHRAIANFGSLAHLGSFGATSESLRHFDVQNTKGSNPAYQSGGNKQRTDRWLKQIHRLSVCGDQAAFGILDAEL